jgi:hypothetical protein
MVLIPFIKSKDITNLLNKQIKIKIFLRMGIYRYFCAREENESHPISFSGLVFQFAGNGSERCTG